MRKFLIVGCGGSGGATVRLLMDQLQADLRPLDITELPAAWQFVHVDVPVDPDKGPGQLPDIVRMGGAYQSFSTPGNTYSATASNVEAKLRASAERRLDPLFGWAPRNKERANQVAVTSGAGQYRAVGRMLTLSRLRETREVLDAAVRRAVAPDAWGQVPARDRGSDVVLPIVVGSMAGGSGASMFLDVCRLLGSIPGISPATIGCFLYTADVFGGLDDGLRKNVEGNALAAIPELFAAISRLSDDVDRQTFEAFGVHLPRNGQPPFARVLPVGRKVGETGALFGDGTQNGVYRGIARAISGLMQSERASQEYLDYFLTNASPVVSRSERFGWRMDPLALPFGSMGYASLSLGRDRYAHYAAQRLARSAVDHLIAGHEDPTNTLPTTEQLRMLLSNQLAATIERVGLPAQGSAAADWFRAIAFPPMQVEVGARDALASVRQGIAGVQGAQAAQWLDMVREGASRRRNAMAAELQQQAYRWAEGWATTLENATKREFLRVTAQFGLPYARELMRELRGVCDHTIAQLSQAGATADAADPLQLPQEVTSQVSALGKAVVGAGHALVDVVLRGWQTSTEKRLRLEGARIGAEVLRSFAVDVLGGLENVADTTLALLQSRSAATAREAGLAQLQSTSYVDWPDESGIVHERFKHAPNEVLLTTAEHFPQHFDAHVQSASSDGIYQRGLRTLRAEVIGGEWETTGAAERFEVLEQVGHWRARVLNRSAADGAPTPSSTPVYKLHLDCNDLIGRADARVWAKGSPFETFTNQSISAYLADPTVAQVEQEQRLATFVDRFVMAMDLARPVIGLDHEMVQRLHGVSVRYFFTFSEMPFDNNSPVIDRIIERITGNAKVTADTAQRIKDAANRSEEVRKIAVFGSYEKYAPLCFSSLLDGVRDRWAGSTPGEQHALWQWKRTRPLSAAVAMSPEEVLRVVAGWYLGGALGLLEVSQDHISVSSSRGWLRFPPQLATEEARLRDPIDAPASLLMSHAWAIAQCSGDPDLTALAPYEALRHIVDTSPSTATASPAEMSGVQLLRGAVNGDELRIDDQPVRHHAFAASLDGTDPEAKLASFRAQLASMREVVLANGMVEESNGGYVSKVKKEQELMQAPLWTEIAPIVLEAFDLLDEIAQHAATASAWSTGATGGVVKDLAF